MTTTELIAEALRVADYPGIKIYWDTQDPTEQGPAYRTKSDSGPLEFQGWTHLSGRKVSRSESVGYDLEMYFATPDQIYSGPDDYGIHPILK